MDNFNVEKTDVKYTATFNEREFDVMFALLADASISSTNRGLNNIESKHRVGIEEDTAYDLFCLFKASRKHV
jgi:hypothetical protein